MMRESLASSPMDEANIVVLTAINLPQSSASYEQWPEECLNA